MEGGDIFFGGGETSTWDSGKYFVRVEGAKNGFGFDTFRVRLDNGFKGVFGRGDVCDRVRFCIGYL